MSNYTEALYKLLPKGEAWHFDIEDNNYKLLKGLTKDFERIDLLIDDIVSDLIPTTSKTRINSWLLLAGVPKYLIRNLPKIADKRKIASFIFSDDGDQCLEKYYKIAYLLGFNDIQLQMCDFNYNFSGMFLCTTNRKESHMDSLYAFFNMENAVYENKSAKAGSRAGTKIKYRQAVTNYLVDSLLFIYTKRCLAHISVITNYYLQRDLFDA